MGREFAGLLRPIGPLRTPDVQSKDGLFVAASLWPRTAPKAVERAVLLFYSQGFSSAQNNNTIQNPTWTAGSEVDPDHGIDGELAFLIPTEIQGS